MYIYIYIYAPALLPGACLAAAGDRAAGRHVEPEVAGEPLYKDFRVIILG